MLEKNKDKRWEHVSMQKITFRNIIYSTLALALVSSYLYIQSQSQLDPIVASDTQYNAQKSRQVINHIPARPETESN